MIASTLGVADSYRWLAPEIIDPPSRAKPVTASKPADVFAFAMLAVEVFTGKVPFSNMKNVSVVIGIVGGKRPAKPQAAEQLGLTAEMWRCVEKCWSPSPNKRPTIDEVVGAWETFVNRYVASPVQVIHRPMYYVLHLGVQATNTKAFQLCGIICNLL